MVKGSMRATMLALVLAGATIVGVPLAQAARGMPGDFNGDGFGDLAIGAPGEDVSSAEAGAVHVLYGRKGGLSARADQFFEQGVLTDEPEVGDEFGSATTAGDFNGDGFSDLAIGAPGESSLLAASHGAVHVLYGSRRGLKVDTAQFFTEDLIGVDQSEASNRFGHAMTAGRFNDDTFVDLAIAHPGETIGFADGAGAVTILYGTAGGLTSTGAQLWHQDVAGVQDEAEEYTDPQTGPQPEQFGSALACGDFDGDGDDDLAIGVPGESVGTVHEAGAVNVIVAARGGLAVAGNRLITQDTDGMRDEAESFMDGRGTYGDRFGSSLAAGRLDRDRYADLAIGVPDERTQLESQYSNDRGDGAVAVVYGSKAGLSDRDDLWHLDSKGIKGASSARSEEQFGLTVAIGRLDGDGFGDLAIGAPGLRDGNGGQVHVLYGTRRGLTDAGSEVWHQDLKAVPGERQNDDRLGASLLVRDLGRGRYADLAIGVPGEDSGTSDDAGRVHVLYGAKKGLNASGIQKWEQDSRGVDDDGEHADAFGASLG